MDQRVSGKCFLEILKTNLQAELKTRPRQQGEKLLQFMRDQVVGDLGEFFFEFYAVSLIFLCFSYSKIEWP